MITTIYYLICDATGPVLYSYDCHECQDEYRTFNGEDFPGVLRDTISKRAYVCRHWTMSTHAHWCKNNAIEELENRLMNERVGIQKALRNVEYLLQKLDDLRNRECQDE